MEKIKENVIEINKTKKSGIESQSTYYANSIVINGVIIRGNLEINILALIWNREDDSETSIFLEVYNKNIQNDIIENNYISFSCEYNEIENYSFNNELLKAIFKTLNNGNAYKNNNNIFINN